MQEREERKSERHIKRQSTKIEREARRENRIAEKKKREEEQEKSEKSEFSAPPGLSWVFSLFNGVKLNINRIHVRYEDDYFNNHRPFSLGLMIDAINLDNATNHWTFHSPNGMHFSRTENKHVNKEFNIARVRVYFNSFSEMLIPTSLWEQT